MGQKNENGWFRGTLESEKVYEGKSMFSLQLSFQRKGAYKVTKRAFLPQVTIYESRDLPRIDFNYYFT